VAQGAPRGRLLVYDPATKETRVLAAGFYYSNGVALSPGGDYLMLVETNRIRVHRHWLKGPKVGRPTLGPGYLTSNPGLEP
jgi:sugar lactone lactonase YvrE